EIRGIAPLRAVEAANLDRRLWPLARVFQGVGKQVDPDLLDEQRVARAGRQTTDAQIRVAESQLAAKLADGVLDQYVHLDGLLLQRLPAEALESEQVIDQAADLLRIGPHVAQIFLAFGGQCGRVVIQQDPREAVDGPQRRAQVVRDGV